MSKPTILTVDDDPQVSAAITRDLASRYGADYRVVRATSGPDALAVLARLALRDEPVALIAADQRMPRMTGIELLSQARAHAPGAKFLLLTAYADTDVAIRAINDIGLVHYLLKPWDPPEERLYPVLDDLLDDWREANRDHTSDVRVVGHRWSERSHDIKMFLARNHVPYRWYDLERDAEARRLQDLAGRYGGDYRVVRATSGPEALAVLARLALRDEPVALIAADQRMPGMTGIEMLSQARVHAPGAKFLLLTAYADTDVAIKAINDIGLDHYLLKPWDPPQERLYPVVDDLLDDWREANRDHTADVRVVGHRWSERSHDTKMFLARNHVPYRWYDIERDPEARRLQDLARAAAADLPLVLVPDGEVLRSPSTLELAGALGLRTTAQQPLYDVCIVGGGPAGLAAAVYAASEGLSTVIVEREAPGGQAGQSAAIENYLGFPKGLTGSDLTQRAVAQVS
ncbi:MAG TPA: FAD-dependent oxidoreductase, partial [Actinomycetota bacterium]|nr:FAD-dependent oxidoreductase [Actinomycetota bacterium]